MQLKQRAEQREREREKEEEEIWEQTDLTRTRQIRVQLHANPGR